MRTRTADTQTLVIIGNGMVSWKLCQRLVEHGANEEIRIVVFGEEPRPAYDRVHLTNLFSGTPEDSLTLSPEEWYRDNGIELHLGDPVVMVDRFHTRVVSASGLVVEYNRLVFATGSMPFVPPIEGVDLPGVFVYRTIENLWDIEDYSRGAKEAAVIGGGLLGLEAAKALYDLGLNVHVIEHGPGLMHRQIDIKGADTLKAHIEKLGVKVHVQKELARIIGPEAIPLVPKAAGDAPPLSQGSDDVDLDDFFSGLTDDAAPSPLAGGLMDHDADMLGGEGAPSYPRAPKFGVPELMGQDADALGGEGGAYRAAPKFGPPPGLMEQGVQMLSSASAPSFPFAPKFGPPPGFVDELSAEAAPRRSEPEQPRDMEYEMRERGAQGGPYRAAPLPPVQDTDPLVRRPASAGSSPQQVSEPAASRSVVRNVFTEAATKAASRLLGRINGRQAKDAEPEARAGEALPQGQPNPTPQDEDRLSLQFADGTELKADMVLISAGIRPRGELAAQCDLETAPNGGIVVNERLETSDDQIYAIGECAVHRGITYGLVLPGYQMVDVLVTNLLGGNATFQGADQSAKLKVMGVTVAALGEYDGETKPLSSALRYTTGGVYRKLVTRNGRLIGAVTVGDWDNLDRIRDLLRSPAPTSFWDMRRFRSTGNLWPREESLKVADWAADALVCGCMQVTRGTLSLAIAEGCATVAELGRKTSAGSMCGSCKPLLADLLGVDENYVPPAAVAIAKTIKVQEQGDEPAPISRREGPRSRRGPSLPMMRGNGPGSVRSPISARGGPSSARATGPISSPEAPSTGRGAGAAPSHSAPGAAHYAAPQSSSAVLNLMPQAPPASWNAVPQAPPPSGRGSSSQLSPASRNMPAAAPWNAAPQTPAAAQPQPPSRRTAAPHTPRPTAGSDAPGRAAPPSVPDVSSGMRPAASSRRPGRQGKRGVVPALSRDASPLGNLLVPPSSPSSAPPPPARSSAPPPVRSSAPPAARSSAPPPSMRSSSPPAARSSAPPPSMRSSSPPAGRTSAPPPSMRSAAPPSARPSAPPSMRSPATPPAVARLSVPPPAMRIATAEAAAELDDEGPVSVRRPSVGPQSRRVARGEPRFPQRLPSTPAPPPRDSTPERESRDSEEAIPTSRSVFEKLARFHMPELERRSSLPPPPVFDDEPVEVPRAPTLPSFEPEAAHTDTEPAPPPLPVDEAEPEPEAALPPPLAADEVAEAARERVRELELVDEDDEDDEDEDLDDDAPSDDEDDEDLDDEGDDETDDAPHLLLPPEPEGGANLVPEHRPRRSWIPPQRLSSLPGTLSMPGAISRTTVSGAVSRVTMQAAEPGLKPLGIASYAAIALVAVLAFAGPFILERLAPPRSTLATLGTDHFLKEVTGYGLVGLVLVSLLLSVSKRWKRWVFRETPIWRMIHGVIGALTLVALALHTSFSLGPRMELNWPPMSLITLLVIDFLIVALFGAVSGIIHAISPGWPAVTALVRRRRWSGVHLALCWPLPVLVILHVLQVYYY